MKCVSKLCKTMQKKIDNVQPLIKIILAKLYFKGRCQSIFETNVGY